MLSKQLGVQGSLQLWRRGEEAAVTGGSSGGGHKREIRGYSVHLCVPTQCPMSRLMVGEWGRALEALSKPARNVARRMPRSGPGTGSEGRWASAVPLFTHEGPLICTGPERGTLLGPSVHPGAGNLQAAASPRGWCRPSALTALVAVGLAGWWQAWLCRVQLGLSVPPVPQGHSTRG